jgi:hypothetical protein
VGEFIRIVNRSLRPYAQNLPRKADADTVSAVCRKLRDDTLEALAQMSNNPDDLFLFDTPDALDDWVFAKQYSAAFLAKLQNSVPKT